MSRKILSVPGSGLHGWDADLTDNFDALGMSDNPMRLPYVVAPGSLPSPGTNDQSIIATNHADLGITPAFDDGTDYRMLFLPWIYECGGAAAGASTTIAVQGQANGFQFGASTHDRAVGFALDIFYAAAAFKSNHGSDPGDWTLTLTNVDSTDSETFTMELNASSGVQQVTIGKPSAVLSFAPGERLRVEASGPSTTDPSFICTLYGKLYVPEVIS